MERETITLQELNNRIGRAIALERGTQQVWVLAELSDVSTKNGHTYMELIQKDENGTPVAKARAMIWRTYAQEITKFQHSTGQSFCSGIKLKLLASAVMHAQFGLSLNITAIDPTFTMGDLLIRRREILERLKKEGVLDDNKKLPFNTLNLRIAVISAPEAAGYGDFMNHLRVSGINYRFITNLFPAVMQGERAVPTVLSALEFIENSRDTWDCVVIIRGGGATSDLSSFENYELAYRIATFPLPVIVGIGHERDITVLDYVAKMRVKTPTAAADHLIGLMDEQVEKLDMFRKELSDIVREKVHSENLQLSYLKTNLENASRNIIVFGRQKLQRCGLILDSLNTRHIWPAREKLQQYLSTLGILTKNIIVTCQSELKNKKHIIEVLSPISVLKRGYSITKIDGKTVYSSKQEFPKGSHVTTILADGELHSTI